MPEEVVVRRKFTVLGEVKASDWPNIRRKQSRQTDRRRRNMMFDRTDEQNRCCEKPNVYCTVYEAMVHGHLSKFDTVARTISVRSLTSVLYCSARQSVLLLPLRLYSIRKSEINTSLYFPRTSNPRPPTMMMRIIL
jgi:hypothetical protein